MNDYDVLVYALKLNEIDLFIKELNNVHDVNSKSVSGNNILHYYVTEFEKFALQPSIVVDLLVKKGIDINYKNKLTNSSALHFSVLRKLYILTKILIDNGAEIDIQDSKGNTPLWKAVMEYRGEKELLEIIKLLVVCGASPDAKNKFDRSPKDVVYAEHENTLDQGSENEWDLQPILKW